MRLPQAISETELMLGPWSSPASMEHICWAAHQHPLQGFLKT